MREVSLAEVYDQIEEEGAAYGLVPFLQNGRCFVAQVQLQVSDGDVVGSLVEEVIPICSVNMNAPLGNVWKSRKQRHEFDVARTYKEARLRREAAKKKASEERSEERARELERLARRFGKADVIAAQVIGIRRGIQRQRAGR